MDTPPQTTSRAVSKREDVYAPPQQRKRVRAHLDRKGGTISSLYVRAMDEYLDRNEK